MTEEKQTAEKGTAQTDSHNAVPDATKSRDNKKEKCRPMTKVVIRRLPPSMTQEQFIEQVSPLPEHDYLYFAKADMSLGQHAFTRAYINFLDQQDIFVFCEKFDNYVFLDSKGNEYPAVVEFAPFQRLPRKRTKKTVDLKSGTIESDPYYITFLESLDTESASSQPKTEYSYQPSDNSQKKITSTPLLDFVKQRKQEKQRIKEEKREGRRRRRLKEEPMIPQVLKNPDADKDTRDNKENNKEKEKIILKENKNRLKKEDKFKDKIRERDVKVPNKIYKDKDRDARYVKKQEDKKFQSKREEKDVCKSDLKNELGEEKHVDNKDDFREKKVEEKKGKSYEKMRQEKKRLADAKKQAVESTSIVEDKLEKKMGDSEIDCKISSCEDKKPREDEKEQENVEENSKCFNTTDVKSDSRINSEKKQEQTNESLESLSSNSESRTKLNTDITSFEYEKSKSNEDINKESDCSETTAKKETKITKRRNSLESGGDSGSNDSSHLRRHKSLDGGDQSNLQKSENDKDKDKKDPRLERRIRNKDRPAMEIYRPGMGKFSKQRLERERSNNDDRASSSQSPTPVSGNSSNNLKTNKSGSEVRTMTFKRSFNRENS